LLVVKEENRTEQEEKRQEENRTEEKTPNLKSKRKAHFDKAINY